MNNDNPKTRFAEKHDIDLDELKQLFVATEQPKIKRRTLAVAVVILLAVVTLLAFRTHAAIPSAMNAVAASRMETLQTTISSRLTEATILASRLYDFLGSLFDESVPAATIRDNWNAAKGDLGALSKDIKNMKDHPIDSGKRLIETGTDRVSRVIAHAAIIARTVQSMVPQILAALQSASSTFKDEPDLAAMLASMDTLFSPFTQGNPNLQTAWLDLRTDFLAWLTNVKRDAVEFRKTLNDGSLTKEFSAHLFSEVVGL